jgi:hypothetical protein
VHNTGKRNSHLEIKSHRHCKGRVYVIWIGQVSRFHVQRLLEYLGFAARPLLILLSCGYMCGLLPFYGRHEDWF